MTLLFFSFVELVLYSCLISYNTIMNPRPRPESSRRCREKKLCPCPLNLRDHVRITSESLIDHLDREIALKSKRSYKTRLYINHTYPVIMDFDGCLITYRRYTWMFVIILYLNFLQCQTFFMLYFSFGVFGLFSYSFSMFFFFFNNWFSPEGNLRAKLEYQKICTYNFTYLNSWLL